MMIVLQDCAKSRALKKCPAFYLTFLYFAIHISVYAQVSPQAIQVLKKNTEAIVSAGNLFNISPRLIASVIYVEHALNVTWVDRDVDPLLAVYGLNVSLGLGQVKINTAVWIEQSLHDSTSAYFLGANCSELIPLSASREETIKRLLLPPWNAKYIAANLAMIRYRWKEAGVTIDDNTEILATLYSAGVVENNIEKRFPRTQPVSNGFGKLAEKFYLSNICRDELPEK